MLLTSPVCCRARHCAGEGWAPGVRRLEVEHSEEGVLGTVYLDLYCRPAKFPSAAHFTLRCSRRREDGSHQVRCFFFSAGVSHGALAARRLDLLRAPWRTVV